MPDITKIIEEINKIHTSINDSISAGFKGVYDKIEEKFSQCDERLTDVETEIAIKKALCKQKKETTKVKRDYLQPIISAIIIAVILGLVGWAFGVKI